VHQPPKNDRFADDLSACPVGASPERNIMQRSGISVAALLTGLLTFEAHSQAEIVEEGHDVPPVSEQPMGKVAVRRGVQGPAGLFTARVNLLVNASKGSLGKPTSLAPDLFYAISDTLQIGLLHTGPMGWQSRPGFGLCLTGKSNGCPKAYDNVGLDLMYGLVFGDLHLSFHSSLYLLPISDPTGVMWTLGLTGKFHFTNLVALYFDPQVGVMLSHRDLYEDQLFIPLELQFQAAPAVALKVLTGVLGQLSNLGDTYQIPLGLGLVGNVNRNVDIGLRISFDNLVGHQTPGSSRTDARSIGLLLTIRS
jgi:hypothetical protein